MKKKYPIERVPLDPPLTTPGNSKYPFAELEIGFSFVVEHGERSTWSAMAYRMGQALGRRFGVRKVRKSKNYPRGGWRVGRVE